MKKLLISLLIVCVSMVTVFITTVTLGTEWYLSGNYSYTKNYNGTITIVHYDNKDDELSLSIPSYIDGLEVSKIAKNSFDCSEIESIEIIDTITYIEDGAFVNCENVSFLSWPSHLVCNKPFENLSNLNELIISFGQDGFMKDFNSSQRTVWHDSIESISSLIIEDGIRYLSDYAFKGLINLESVELPETIEAIGKYCFYDCYNLSYINLPYGLVSLGDNCFASSLSASSNTVITIPQSVSYFGDNCLTNNFSYFSYKDSDSANYLSDKQLNHEIIDLSFASENYSLQLGQSLQFKTKGFPNGYDEEIAFFSSDQSVATISEDGIVQTSSTGTTEITLVSQTGKYTSTLNVEFNNEAKFMVLSVKDKYKLETDQFDTLNTDLTENKLTFHSSDKNIISVNEEGVVTGLKSGTAYVDIIDENYNVASYLFRVQQPVTDIKLPTDAIMLRKGNSFTISPTVYPRSADNKHLTYSSSDEEVCVVNSKGKVTAISNGTAVITVTTNDGSNISTNMTIGVSNSSITVDTKATPVMKGKRFRLRVSSNDSSNLIFSSSDTSIATVSSSGIIYGKSEGSCVISISNKQKTAFASVSVEVIEGFSYGIDISRWNGNHLTQKNFDDCHNDGIDFVYIRAGYANDTKDINFDSNYRLASKAGFDIGAYHYVMATDTEMAKKEAYAMLEWIKGKKFEYPIMMDIEDSVQKYMDKVTWNNIVNTYCGILSDAGYECIVYSYASMLNKTYGKYDSWVAQWNATSPHTFRWNYTIWQFTNYGRVPGFAGRVDMNICFYDYPSYIKSHHLNGY